LKPDSVREGPGVETLAEEWASVRAEVARAAELKLRGDAEGRALEERAAAVAAEARAAAEKLPAAGRRLLHSPAPQAMKTFRNTGFVLYGCPGCICHSQNGPTKCGLYSYIFWI